MRRRSHIRHVPGARVPRAPVPSAPLLGFPLLGILLLGILLLTGCSSTTSNGPAGSAEALPTGLVGPVAPTVGPGALRYVALGDSYTFGDGVQLADRWPNQLARILRPDLDMDVAANLSGRSTASRDVIEDQLPQLIELQPQFVSVQVGVNDVIHDTPSATYSANMGVILDTVLLRVDADRVVVVTAADFTLTPDGPSRVKDPIAASARIKELNDIMREAAATRGIAVVDISPIGDRVQEDPSLVQPAPTGERLHPSGKQYAGWADLIATTVRRLFATPLASDSPEAPAASADVPGPSVSP